MGKHCCQGSVPGTSGETATGVGGVRVDARAARIERPRTPLPVRPPARADAACSSAAAVGCGGGGISASALTILFHQQQQQHSVTTKECGAVRKGKGREMQTAA